MVHCDLRRGSRCAKKYVGAASGKANELEDSFASLRWTKDRRICGTGFGTRRLLLRTGTKYRVNLYGVDVPYTTTATYK